MARRRRRRRKRRRKRGHLKSRQITVLFCGDQ